MSKHKTKKQTKAGPILTGKARPFTKDEIFWAVAGRLDKDHRAIAETETIEDFLNLLDDYILPYWLEIRSKAVLEHMPGLTSHSEVMLLILRNHIVKLNSTSSAIMLLPLPNDWDELEYWSATVRKALKSPPVTAGKKEKKKRKPKDSILADSLLMRKLLEIVISNNKYENKHPERPSIAYIQRLAGVGSKTPYKPTCANFLSTYKKTYPKPPKKGSKFDLGDGNRQDQSTYDPEPDW